MKKFLSVIGLVGLLGSTLYAKNPIDTREQNQRERIRQGVRSGELTKSETRRLVKEEARIRRTETRARKDGEITLQERLKLDRQLDKASRDIFKEKHDKQDR
ncbi:MAG TPA: hypothetical protein VFY29_19800 [Terriglobia bacterium]|nr:hypothetical protein [Terriglobia bacterium]